MVAAARVDLVPEDFVERDRPLDLVVLNRDVRGVGQDPVLSEESDQVGESYSRTADKGTDGALQPAEKAPLTDGLINNVGVSRRETKDVSDCWQETLPGSGSGEHWNSRHPNTGDGGKSTEMGGRVRTSLTKRR